MKIHDCEQGSVSWGQLRAGIPTASEFGNLVTPKFEIRTGEMVETYLAEKVEEWWLGWPLIEACTFRMDQGNILENEARPWASLLEGQEIKQVGFVTNDDGKAGCSPDGIIGLPDFQFPPATPPDIAFVKHSPNGNETGFEIKCRGTAHVKCLLSGAAPKDLPQIHGGLLVTGFNLWKDVYYRRGFPKLVMTVERDERIQGTLREAIDAFNFKLEVAKERMIDLNGGPPKRLTFERQAETPFVSEIPS